MYVCIYINIYTYVYIYVCMYVYDAALPPPVKEEAVPMEQESTSGDFGESVISRIPLYIYIYIYM